MTREEQINQAWWGYKVRSNRIYDEISFKEGAKWADENPNLYSDEKYQTIKVSQLDELNRKAKLYDEVVDNLHEIVKACWEYYEEQVKYDMFITEHVTEMYKRMEE